MGESIRIRLLGPPSVTVGEAAEHPLPDRSARLLAYLALEPRRHSRERLAAIFWPDHDPERARNLLRTAIHRLRGYVGDEVIVSDRRQVAISGSAVVQTDVGIIEEAVAHVRRHHPRDEALCTDCAERLDAILHSWQAPLLEGALGSSSAEYDDWLSATSTRIDDQLGWSRERLARHLGTETQTGPSAVAPATKAPRSALEPREGNLPLETDLFVGRDEEVARCTTLVRTRPLVTMWGPGGAGKSRLSLRVARELLDEFPGGAWLVDLTAFPDRQPVLPIIAGTLGVTNDRRTNLLSNVVALLELRPTLLVLDNCEHLVAECAEAVRDLAERCGSLRMIATSREPLRERSETLFPILPLPVPPSTVTPDDDSFDLDDLFDSPAVELFVDRGQRADPAFTLSRENAHAIVRLLRRIDGVPLAIELAANKLRLLDPQGILEEINRTDRTLTSQRLDHDRHRSVEALVDWSFRLLSPGARHLMAQLAVFSGSFELGAVRAVCSAPRGFDEAKGPWPVEPLRELVDKSLLRVVASERGWETTRPGASARRYAQIWVVRTYALGRLRDFGLESEVRDAHLAWVRGFVVEEFRKWHGSRFREAWDRFQAESSQIESALHWAADCGRKAVGMDLCNRLQSWWASTGNNSAGGAWYERFVAIPGEVSSLIRAAGLQGMSSLFNQTDASRQRRYAEDLLGMADRLPPNVYFCHALTELAMDVQQNDRDYAYACALRALRMARRIGIAWNTGHARVKLVWMTRDRSDGDLIARYQLEQTVKIVRREEVGNTASLLLAWSAGQYGLLGDLERCERLAKEAIDRSHPESNPVRLSAAMALAALYRKTRRYVESVRQIREAVAIAARCSIGRYLAACVEILPSVLGEAGLHELSARACGVFGGRDFRSRSLDSLISTQPAIAAARDSLGEDRWVELVDAGSAMPTLRVVDIIDEALERLVAQAAEQATPRTG